MPIYEYVCQDCGKKYDKFVRSIQADVKLTCPTCGSGQAKKALSAFSSHTGGPAASRTFSSGPACGPVG